MYVVGLNLLFLCRLSRVLLFDHDYVRDLNSPEKQATYLIGWQSRGNALFMDNFSRASLITSNLLKGYQSYLHCITSFRRCVATFIYL